MAQTVGEGGGSARFSAGKPMKSRSAPLKSVKRSAPLKAANRKIYKVKKLRGGGRAVAIS